MNLATADANTLDVDEYLVFLKVFCLGCCHFFELDVLGGYSYCLSHSCNVLWILYNSGLFKFLLFTLLLFYFFTFLLFYSFTLLLFYFSQFFYYLVVHMAVELVEAQT